MTVATKTRSQLSQQVYDFVRQRFATDTGQRRKSFKSDPRWKQFCQQGTELWLDSGDIHAIGEIWTQEFSALTTNNTLLNKEIQTGHYDDLILEAVELLHDFSDLSHQDRLLELGFILNAAHALRLVDEFDAYVSVEEHTILAHDVGKSLEYGRRYHAICPERFFVKIPLTAAGILATRQLSREGIAVNHTLGFSARQNYVVARLAKPTFVNVFLGRLNSFVNNNDLGGGDLVGEKATLASQAAISQLRESKGISTRQIGASIRSWQQYITLAGIDVITAPPKAASQLLARGDRIPQIESNVGSSFSPGVKAGIESASAHLDTLWDIDDKVAACVDAIEREDLTSFKPQDLVEFFEAHDCSDLLVHWSNAQVETSADEGKIPTLQNWAQELSDRSIGLDALMNLAGLNHFAADQKAMDNHICQIWERVKE